MQARLDARKADRRVVQQQLAGSTAIATAERQVASLEAERDRCQSDLRKLEAQAEDLSATVKRLDAMLYGGSIHDTRELASAQHEIAHARERQLAVEDREIEAMEKLEEAENDLKRKRDELERLQADREGGLESLRQDETAASQDIAELESQSRQLAAGIDPKLVATYERLRARLGHAVSAMDSGTCQWCRVQVPSQDAQHARGDAIVTCANCGRILYAE
jgi:predicted  nucleic acid-binding Zn-ribbon protein